MNLHDVNELRLDALYQFKFYYGGEDEHGILVIPSVMKNFISFRCTNELPHRTMRSTLFTSGKALPGSSKSSTGT